MAKFKVSCPKCEKRKALRDAAAKAQQGVKSCCDEKKESSN